VSVHVEVEGPVATVILDRPEARNAVDRQTAEALADAFRAFDADENQSVAVLYGAGGTFCAGADLKAMDNRVEPDGFGDGSTPRSAIIRNARGGLRVVSFDRGWRIYTGKHPHALVAVCLDPPR
jgi:enoyl-CoA hydratase/carnithine racemase